MQIVRDVGVAGEREVCRVDVACTSLRLVLDLKVLVCVESSISLESGAGAARCLKTAIDLLVVEFFLHFNIFYLSLYCSEE